MQLIKNEWIKIWSQRNAQIMCLLVIIAVIGFTALNKYYSPDNNSKEARLEENEKMLEDYNEIMTSPGMEEEDIAYYAEQIQLTEYRIANDLPAEGAMFFQDHMEQSINVTIMLVSIFTMVITAAIVSNEFGTGTVKMLLTRPVARWKILLSKLIASLTYGIAVFVIGIVTAIVIGLFLFPTESAFSLSLVNGEIVKTNIEIPYGEIILYNAMSIFMTILFAFMLGSLFGSSTLAVSLALIILLMGTLITAFIAHYDFAKYIWFANDLSYFAPGNSPMIEGVTLNFSIVVNVVYAVIFLVVTFGYFTRRDITA
jgi:ABC-2 type transport system permease protein